MIRRPATLFASIFFAAGAAAHFVRVLTGFPLMIGGWYAPMWPSVLAVFLAGGLSVFLWREGTSR